VNRQQKIELLNLLNERERRYRRTRIHRMYPEAGPLRRELYIPHCQFFEAGAKYRERAIISANRVGKTEGVGGYELTLHLTGDYPGWWAGKRFTKPIKAWAAGDTSQTVRDIIQTKLLGPPGEYGIGLIPGDLIVNTKNKAGSVPDTVESIAVKHVSGGTSHLGLKCHPAGERILTKAGAWANIEEIKIGDGVVLADGKIGIVTQTHSYADADVIEIQAEGGRLRVTPNHKVFRGDGRVVDAGDLQIGDILSLTPSLGIEKTGIVDNNKEDWLIIMTAVMIGDGCTRGKTPFFTCNDPEQVDELRKCLPDDLTIERMRNTITYKISSNTPNHNKLTKSLRRDGLWNKLSKHKYIPDWVFGLSAKQKKTFLFWLWSCDGTINNKRASYTSASYRLAEDVVLLLRSVNIYANIRSRKVKLNGKHFNSHTINLHGENRVLFTEIGKFNRDCTCNIKPRPKYKIGEIFQITKIGKHNVFGIGVEGCHEYISGGFRVGNSYDQKRKSFQGTEQDVIWLDEECDLGIYAECLLRTMTTNGLVMCTFTPLLGLSETVLSFMPGGKIPEDFSKTGKYVVNATWDDAPHLTEQQKTELLTSIPPYQRDARSKGIPQLGAGAIYPIAEDDITIEPFEIPPSWPKCYALDVGWNRTAALWGAWDQQSDVVYLFSEHYRGEAEPIIHAEGIKARGEWIPGVIDPAARGRSQKDGTRLVDEYIALGLHLSYADNSVESGLLNVWQRFSTGKLKVFNSLRNFLAEYRIYRRDEKGKIVKENDHLMDDVRYLCMSGLSISTTAPPENYQIWDSDRQSQTDTVDNVTGY